MQDSQNPDQHRFHPMMDMELQKHLMTEMHSEVAEVGEIQNVIQELEGKESRRVKRIQKHMMTCGKCLSAQIKSGTLIEVATYWNMRQQTGGGRYPKLHYMVN